MACQREREGPRIHHDATRPAKRAWWYGQRMSAGAAFSEAMGAFEKKIRDSTPMQVSQGRIADETEDGEPSVWWVEGFGLSAEVILVGRLNDTRVRAVVAGSLFDAHGGGLHSRPIKKGDNVLVALLEGGDPNGHAVIFSRVQTTFHPPAGECAFRKVTEANVQTDAFDLFPDGEGWRIGLKNAGMFIRLEGESGDFAVAAPDGTSISIVKDEANGGWTTKLKNGNGAVMMATAKGVSLKSKNGLNFIEVTDEGVFIQGKTTKVMGKDGVYLNTKAGDNPYVQGASMGPVGVATTVTTASTKVFVGR